MSFDAAKRGNAMSTKTQVPAVEGWFTTDAEHPALLGNRCTTCGTYFFPKAALFCRNPACAGSEFADVELSTRGKVWSYTDACYQPPAPYIVPTDEHVPFAIAAVELAAEGLVVLGQVVPGITVDQIKVGDEVELVIDTLYSDDEHEYLIWKWSPVSAGGAA